MTDITAIILILIAVVSLVVSVFIIPLIKGKLTADQLQKVQFWVNIAVTAVEQTITGEGKGPDKKAAVLEFLENRGITYDPEAVDAMIEAAVYGLK